MGDFLTDFKEFFPVELLPTLMDMTIQIHDDNPLGYLQRAKSLWQLSTMMQHTRRTVYERKTYRSYGRRSDTLRHNGQEVLEIQKVIQTAFACTQIRFYDLPENWDLLRTVRGHMRPIQMSGSLRFKKLYHLLMKLYLSLEHQRWWAILAWTVYYKVEGTPWFFGMLNDIQVKTAHLQKTVRRPERGEIFFLMDDPIWNSVRMNHEKRGQRETKLEEYVMTDEEMRAMA
jgi:hypothetical protein